MQDPLTPSFARCKVLLDISLHYPRLPYIDALQYARSSYTVKYKVFLHRVNRDARFPYIVNVISQNASNYKDKTSKK